MISRQTGDIKTNMETDIRTAGEQAERRKTYRLISRQESK